MTHTSTASRSSRVAGSATMSSKRPPNRGDGSVAAPAGETSLQYFETRNDLVDWPVARSTYASSNRLATMVGLTTKLSCDVVIVRAALSAEYVNVKRRRDEDSVARSLFTAYEQALEHVRIEHGARLLRETAMSVAEIADMLGFSEESAFRKAYRRVLGRPPRRVAR